MKIFIVAPHFPPSATPPAQRVRLYVQHMHKFGLTPVVLTVDHYYREELADPWMVELAGDAFERVELNCLDQRKTRRFGLGDLGLRLLPFLYAKLVKEIRKQKPVCVLYPVPPWYIMLVAPFVKKATGVPYGIDFIDPWVHKGETTGAKAKVSQWIARNTEGRVLKAADFIAAVSQGILDDIEKRYSFASRKPMLVLPYGVEAGDYSTVGSVSKNSSCIWIRYIGAISDVMMPVVKVGINALKDVGDKLSIHTEFIGTSYAGAGMERPRLNDLIGEGNRAIVEKPSRVSYREALRLTMESDLLLLFGDTTHYYAASKLMGLIASGKPFIAFVHEKSFPAVFLTERKYPYLLTYEDSPDSIAGKQEELVLLFFKLIEERQDFCQPINTADPSFEEHTAFGMTKKISNQINQLINAGETS